jgi:hypothetical protein
MSDQTSDEWFAGLKKVADTDRCFVTLTDVMRYLNDKDAQIASLTARNKELEQCLQFYARGNHFTQTDPLQWDSVSGEPPNFLCDDQGLATIEDGSLARMAMEGVKINWEDEAVDAAIAQGEGDE